MDDALVSVRRLEQENPDDLLLVRELLVLSQTDGPRPAPPVVRAHAALDPARDERAKAALGVVLFSRYAETCRAVARAWTTLEPGESDLKAHSWSFLGDSATLSFFKRLYGLDSSRDVFRAPMRLHEVGTTSFIFHIPDHDRALKVLKPWYLESTQSSTGLEHKTDAYLDDYGRLAEFLPWNTATAIESERRYILMRFVPGETLERFLARTMWDRPPEWQRLGALLTDLCAVLKECDDLDPPVNHGDLSLRNILVERSVGQGMTERICLIDFGINHLSHERVGSDDEFQVWRARTAPEVLTAGGSAKPTLEGDVYGLGAVVAESVLGGRFDPKALQASVDEIYTLIPGLGYVLDDLLEPDRNFRLTLLSGDRAASAMGSRVGPKLAVQRARSENSDGGHPYENVSRRLRTEFALADLAVLSRRHPWVNWAVTLMSLPLSGVREAFSELRRRRSGLQSSLDEATSGFGLIAVAVNAVVWAVFGWDLGRLLAAEGAARTELLMSLPGWITGVASSVLAAKGYVSIFNGVPFASVSRPASVTAFLYSWFFALPVLYALILDAHAWPFAGAVGVAMVAWHNRNCWKMCAQAMPTLEAAGYRLSPGMKDNCRRMRGWWRISAVFSAGLLTLGTLIGAGVLTDEVAYAAIYVAALVKMYSFNASEDAAAVRGALLRFTGSYRRAIRKLAMSGDA